MLRYRINGHNFAKLTFGVFKPLINFKISRHILITKKQQKSVRLMIPSDLRSPYPNVTAFYLQTTAISIEGTNNVHNFLNKSCQMENKCKFTPKGVAAQLSSV